MKVSSLKLVDYRNYEKLELKFYDDLNIFIGCNAQGKTNILEAVYYAACGSSFRSSTDSELVHWNAPGGSISLGFQRFGVENQLDFTFYRDRRRTIAYNGRKISVKELIGAVNVVLFAPDDLQLIKGAPAGRRRFLDMEISQASPAYYHELIKYNRLLQQRNSLLKDIRERRAGRDMLEYWNPQLAESAAKITAKRLEAVKKFNMLANLMQKRISGNEENLSIAYQIKGSENEPIAGNLKIWYNEMLTRSGEEDVYRGVTGIGPHRDDIIISVNGINLRSFGSQGQQRTGVLAMKLSELEFIRSETGEYPILLLDDVMSELDAGRRQQLLSFIGREGIQTLITATDEAYFDMQSVERYFRVAAGSVAGAGYGKADG